MNMTPGESKCRLCYSNAKNGIGVFSKQGTKLSISSILSQHFKIEVLISSEDDPLSKIICKKCWRITDQFHKLYCDVEKNLIKYQEISNNFRELGEATETQAFDHIKKSELEEVTETPSFKDIKEEELILDDFNPFIENTASSDDKDSVFKTEEKSEEMEYSNNYLTIDMLSTEQLNLKTGKRAGKKDKFNSKKKTKSIAKNSTKSKTKSTLQLQIMQQDKEICDFLGMECEICNVATKTFTDLMNHYRNEHRIEGYIKCCNRKYLRRNKLHKHIQNHRFPDRYKCNFCGKSYLDKDYYQRHIRTHDPSTKTFQCLQCPKRFDSQKRLDLHFLRIHSTAPRPFVCDICQKSFSTKRIVATHLLAMHAQQFSSICDTCGKIFKSRVQLDIHYKINHSGIHIPREQCTLCSAWLSDKKSLKSHMGRHAAAQAVCTQCGKLCSNKYAVLKHIQYAHSGKSYQCHMCDKVVKSQISLKEHISTHTGLSLYKCSYCSMDFKSSANMYKHRKNSHPVEYQLNRGKYLNIRNTPNN